MKRVLLFSLLVTLSVCAFAQNAQEQEPSEAKDAKHSSSLFFVFLNRPSNAPTYSKEKGEEIQAGHMANIRRLHAEGKLKMAGPFMDDTQLRGIFVFTANNIDEVKEWIASDPAVKAGRLVGDVHPWTPAKGVIRNPEAGVTGMENFVMLIYLWTSDGKTKPKEQVQSAFQGHMKYQLGLYDDGTTEIGGPFTDAMEGKFIGIVIAHGNREKGEKVAAADPLVSAGVARAEVHEWITGKGVLHR